MNLNRIIADIIDVEDSGPQITIDCLILDALTQ